MKIKPKKNCKACHGTGLVYDIVDWGATTAQMDSLCDCVLEQIEEENENEEVELDVEGEQS